MIADTYLSFLTCAILLTSKLVFSQQADYRVIVPSQKATIFHVEADLPGQSGDILLHAFPNAGEAGESEYARFIVHVEARSSGRPLSVTRPDPFTWQLHLERPSIVHLSYDVLPDAGDDLQLDGHWIEPSGGYFDARSLLLFTQASASLPSTITVVLPSDWHLRSGVESNATGFVGRNYASLTSSPFLFGSLTERSFIVNGIAHRLVFAGAVPKYDSVLLDANLRKIALYEQKLFGSAPFNQFTALFRWRPDLPYGGGIEHPGGMYMNIGKEWMIDLPVNMSGTFAHEYFHSWNAERMHPRGLSTSGFDASGRTRLSWFQEGFANYYSNLTLVRTGILNEEDLYASIGRDITNLESQPSRKYVSLSDASVLSDSGSHDQLDLYAGGEIVGFLLDLKIRDSSVGRHSLDDVMRMMYAESGQSGYSGYSESDIIRAINFAAGTDLGPFLQNLVDKPGSPDYDACLRGFGISVEITTDEKSGKRLYHLVLRTPSNEELKQLTAHVSLD